MGARLLGDKPFVSRAARRVTALRRKEKQSNTWAVADENACTVVRMQSFGGG
jgi:hypothetical protein